MKTRTFLLPLAISLLVFPRQASRADETSPDFETVMAPLLIKRCVECHEGRNPSGDLLLTTREGLLEGGDSGPAIDLDSPRQSHLLLRVHDVEMPPQKQGKPQKLPAKEVELLERWLIAGAPWPEKRRLDLFERTSDVRAGRDWWSLQPIQRPQVPKLKLATQPENEIDAFILARLEKEQMVPAPQADKRTLLRRLYYDLLGMPPTTAQIEQFENDTSPSAWEDAIDTLLASEHYGERWGRYWLDLVRFADTSGYERDQEKPFAWKYRDWVVASLNSDLPYHQFIVEQLAGDELPERSERTVIATGFLRLGTWNDEPNDPLDYQYDRLEDLIHTTSSAFLGMTVKCARCHSHKFDPITQEDYYRMGSAFWAGPIAPRGRGLLGGPKLDELGFDDVLGWSDLGPTPAPLYVLKNGERERPLQKVVPASLSLIPALERVFDPPAKGSTTSRRRLQLARWIAHPNNPLTPRVLVNRLWLHHFGKGIVRSPNNFGFLADPPTHPELLEWLTAEFMSGGWTIKRMHRLILTSRTWRQSSLHPRFAEQAKLDAGNRTWWRAERRRLDAEALRDSMLATTGELDTRLGGPGFRPSISPDALEGLSKKAAAWQASSPEEQSRRSLYIFSKRGLPPPMMTTFDFCDTTQSSGKRGTTTVPTQSLAMLNNQFVHLRSESLARSVLAATADPRDQVTELWARVYGRKPSRDELDLATRHLSIQSGRFEEQHQERFGLVGKDAAKRAEQLSQALVLHLRADRGVTVDSANRVSQWKDQSGHDHHAQQATASHQPSLDRSGFGAESLGAGRAAVSFDGQRRFMHLHGALLKEQDCTIIAIVNDRGTAGHREILSNWNGAAGNSVSSLFLGLTSKDTVRFSDAFAAAGRIRSPSRPFVITAINGADRSAVFLNGRELSARKSRLPARDLSTDWVIGQQGNINGEYWNGGIAEIRVYARALSDGERAFVEREAAQRFDIPFATPNSVRALPGQALALASLAHVLLNSNEFLYVD